MKLTEDGSLVSKHVAVGNEREVCFVIPVLLCFIGWYIECININDTNNIILLRNIQCDPPVLWVLQAVCTLGTAQHIMVASCLLYKYTTYTNWSL